MNLLHDLAQERIHWLQEQPAPVSAVEVMAMDCLRRAGIEGKALRLGERAPAFQLMDQQGHLCSLDELIANGPAVLMFYRGHWCPFCTLTLRSYLKAAPRFAAMRTPVVAISPQGHAATTATLSSLGEGLRLLSDQQSHVARAYGLAYDLPPALKQLFEGEYDTQLPRINADDGWTLPVSATYVIGANGLVLRAHVEVDYRLREDPEYLLAWLVAHRGNDADIATRLAEK